MPMAAHSEIHVARQRQPRREWLLLVAGSPQPIRGHHLARELEPFAARIAAVIPVQPGMRAQDFQPAADEQADEEQVDEMADADPIEEA